MSQKLGMCGKQEWNWASQLTRECGNPILLKQQSAIRKRNFEHKVSSAHKAVIIEKRNC